MSVFKVGCEQCSKQFRVAAKHAGKRAKCPSCESVILIPNLSVSSSADVMTDVDSGVATSVGPKNRVSADDPLSGTEVTHDPLAPKGWEPTVESGEPTETLLGDLEVAERIELIKSRFQDGFQRPYVSLLYRVSTAFSALFMLSLPVIYVGLIGLVAIGLVYHAIYSGQMFSAVRGARTFLGAVALYVTPFFVGGIGIFFMFKPLLSRPSGHQRTRSITRGGEPVFFALVDEICERVNSPKPVKINVDATINASASYLNGFWSVFGRRQLVLTVGVPLIAGFSVEQLAGVLAHEFGHFSQGSGMRFSFVTRRISGWLARVVYERDSWDDWLAESVEDAEHYAIALVFLLANGFVMAIRGIFYVMMITGALICGVLMRQMEYHADLFEIRLCGSKVFKTTTRRLHELGIAAEEVFTKLLGDFIRKGEVVNVPELLATKSEVLTKRQKSSLDRKLRESSGGLFDSHPCDRDRIQAAEKEAAPGVFSMSQPARQLFVHYDSLAENVSHDMLGVSKIRSKR